MTGPRSVIHSCLDQNSFLLKRFDTFRPMAYIVVPFFHDKIIHTVEFGSYSGGFPRSQKFQMFRMRSRALSATTGPFPYKRDASPRILVPLPPPLLFSNAVGNPLAHTIFCSIRNPFPMPGCISRNYLVHGGPTGRCPTLSLFDMNASLLLCLTTSSSYSGADGRGSVVAKRFPPVNRSPLCLKPRD